MKMTLSSIATPKGPADWFTGDVYIDTAAEPTKPSRLAAANPTSARLWGVNGSRPLLS